MSGEDEQKETTPTEPEAPPREDAERLRAELEASAKRVDELLDRLMRAQADYENLQKRAAREVQEVREVANESLLLALLPVVDDFDRASESLPGDAGEGVRMLRANLWRVLREAGLEAISPLGQPFDPYDQEVVGQANDEDMPEGIVKEVVQKGYRYRRRLLRAAKVIVVKRGE